MKYGKIALVSTINNYSKAKKPQNTYRYSQILTINKILH